MSTIGGPNINRNGLILHLDAANPKCFNSEVNQGVWTDLKTNVESTIENYSALTNWSSVAGGVFDLDGSSRTGQTWIDISPTISSIFS